jgi:hypothetical protein
MDLTMVASASAAATGCPGLSALNPVCQVASLGGTVATAGVDAVLNGLSQWVATGAEWLLSQIGTVLVSTTAIDIGAGWFRENYGEMTALAGVVILPMLVISAMQAVYRQNAGQLLRSFFIQLPLALLLGVVAIQIVLLCLSATDAMSDAVAGGSGSAVTSLLAGVTKGLLVAVGDPTMATFVLLMVALLVAAAAFVLWLELLVRAAAVYVAVLFLPLALATLVWPSVSHWCRRLVETLTALILSKFVIVATLSLAANAIASGTAGSGHDGSGFASVLAGAALLVLSTFVPFAILRLIPAVEAGAISHLEGARQRGAAALTRVPKTAASFALNGAFDSYGAAKLMAQAGPPGTGGAGGVGGGIGGVGGGGVGGTTGADDDASGGVPWDGQVGTDELNYTNGGLVPDENGMMQGVPGSREQVLAEFEELRRNPRPLGPKPVLEVKRRGMEGQAAPASPPAADQPLTYKGLPVIGKPGPNDRQYVMDEDACGPVIRYVPGTGP